MTDSRMDSLPHNASNVVNFVLTKPNESREFLLSREPSLIRVFHGMTIILSSAITASLFHFMFFAMESLMWGSKSVCRIFGVTPEIATSRIVKSFAFNQGFYNLFLSLGAAWSAMQLGLGGTRYANVLVFCCLSMVGAALALFLSSPKKIAAVLIQGGPPAVCLWGLHQAGLFF